MRAKTFSYLIPPLFFIGIVYSQITPNIIKVETRNISEVLKTLNYYKSQNVSIDVIDNLSYILSKNFNFLVSRIYAIQLTPVEGVNLPPIIQDVVFYGFSKYENGIYYYAQPNVKLAVLVYDPENETLKYQVLVGNQLITSDTNVISFTLPNPGKYKLKIYACDSRQCTSTERTVVYQATTPPTPTPTGGGGVVIPPKPKVQILPKNVTQQNITKEEYPKVQAVTGIEIIKENWWLILIAIFFIILVLLYSRRK